MGMMTLEFEFKDGAFAELRGPDIKFWLALGLPNYEGSLEGFQTAYPAHFQQLLDLGAIKKVD